MKKLLIVVVLLLSARPVLAEQPIIDLGTFVIDVNRIGQKEYLLTGDQNVISEKDIEDSGAQTVADVLQDTMGVYVYSKGASKNSVVDVRGFGETAISNVLVLVNGRKLNSVDLSGPDFIQVPLESVKRIEVLRGAGSVLYGDNAVGGVINIVTKKGEGKLSGSIGASFASEDSLKQKLEASGASNGFSYYLLAQQHDNRGYRQQSDVLTKDINTRLGYKLNDRVDIDFEVSHHEDDTDLPGGLDENELAMLGRRGSTDTSFSTTKDTSYHLQLDVDPFPEQEKYGHFVFDVNFKDRDVEDSFFKTFDSKRNIQTLGILGKYVFNSTVFEQEVNFVTGIDFYTTENDILGSGTNSDDLTIEKEELGFYGFGEFEVVDDVFINLGTRYQSAKYTFDNRAVSTFDSSKPNEWVSTGGMKFRYGDGSNVHLNFQQTFRFLATDEFYSSFSGILDTDLKPQTGLQVEAGVKHNYDGRLKLSATPYWIKIEDEIYYDPVTFSNSNYPQTQRFGVETGAEVDLLRFLDLEFLQELVFKFGYTYQQAEFDGGDSDGNTIPLVSSHLASQSLGMKFWDHFLVSLSGRYIGDRVIGNDIDNDKSKAQGYYVADMKLVYNRKNYEIYFVLNNLFDKEYNVYEIEKNAIGVTRDVYPAAKKNFEIGLNLKF